MKSLRYLSTLGVLAICTVFASAQDSGLGRGQGGGSNRDKDSGSKSRSDSSSSSSNSSRTSPPQEPNRSRDRSPEPSRSAPPVQGGSRDRTSEPSRSAPPVQGGSRDRSSEPSRSAPPAQGGSRDRSSEPGRSAPPVQGGSRDRTSEPGRSAPPVQGGSRDRSSEPGRSAPPVQGGSRDRSSEPTRGAPPTSQDGGLGRGQGSGTTKDSLPTRQGGATRDPIRSGDQGTNRDRGNSGSGTTKDSIPTRQGGATRDPMRSGDQTSGRDQGLGRGGTSQPIRGEITTNHGRTQGQPSRSGSVGYNGSNNINGLTRERQSFTAPNTFGIIKSTSMEQRARREDAPRNFNGLNYNGWRTGYCHYNNNWNDNYFWYPNYCFSPFGNVNIVISPWYSYSFLPGYLTCSNVYVTNYRGYWGWNTGFVYVNDNYNSYDNDYRFSRNRDLDYAIDDLQDGFERRDFRSLDRLVPDRGQIAIYRDGRYDYSIDTRDFADLLNDLSSNANTNRYRILETRTNRGTARISAVHEYTDQWGSRQRVYHSIYLENENGQMVVREFGTSNSRIW